MAFRAPSGLFANAFRAEGPPPKVVRLGLLAGARRARGRARAGLRPPPARRGGHVRQALLATPRGVEGEDVPCARWSRHSGATPAALREVRTLRALL